MRKACKRTFFIYVFKFCSITNHAWIQKSICNHPCGLHHQFNRTTIYWIWIDQLHDAFPLYFFFFIFQSFFFFAALFFFFFFLWLYQPWCIFLSSKSFSGLHVVIIHNNKSYPMKTTTISVIYNQPLTNICTLSKATTTCLMKYLRTNVNFKRDHLQKKGLQWHSMKDLWVSINFRSTSSLEVWNHFSKDYHDTSREGFVNEHQLRSRRSPKAWTILTLILRPSEYINTHSSLYHRTINEAV